MTYAKLLHEIIERGIEGAKKDYAEKPNKLEGAVAGFEACRQRTPEQLHDLLKRAEGATWQARQSHYDGKLSIDEYWKLRCYEAEVEWVCNCISVALANQGEKPIIPPTARALMLVNTIFKANEVQA
jgi:hypothetical protein